MDLNFSLSTGSFFHGFKNLPVSNPRRFPVPRSTNFVVSFLLLCFLLLSCNRYLHPLDVNISHIEHDFPQLESTQETDSIDVVLKINFFKKSGSETNETYQCISSPLTAFP